MEYWESVDSFWGETAKKYINIAVENKTIKLENHSSYNSIRPGIAVRATREEEKNIVFGSEILEQKGCVIICTFKNSDFEYDYVKNILTIRTSKILTSVNDLNGTSSIWFFVKSVNKKTSTRIGISGLRAYATSEARINKENVVKLDRNLIK
jgi:hypothetical protein